MRCARVWLAPWVAILGLVAGLLFCAPLHAADDGKALQRALRESWVYFDAGNLREAESGFKRALDIRGGKQSAELQYGLSLIPWKRGLARQSYWQLKTALAVSEEAGGGDEWRHRIQGRIRYIERNFSAVTLRHPGRGKPLPLLLDPPPRDPVLRHFVDAVVTMIDGGTSATDGAQRLFVPSGRYWIGDNQIELIPGAVLPGQQQVIYLPVAFGAVLKRYKDRRRMQEEGQPIPLLDDEGVAVRGAAPSDPLPAAAAGENPVGSAPEPLDYPVVRSYLADRTAYDISERWTQVPFHVRYSVYCPDGDAEHRFEFPDYDFYVRFESGGVLRVRGAELLRVRLGSDWLTGEQDRLNEVEILFDGTTVLVSVNGIEIGPIRVRELPPPRPGSWTIRMSDDRARMTYLSVQAPD